jgi:hypothetical protein
MPERASEPLFTTIRALLAAVAPHEQRAWAENYGSPPDTEWDILRPALDALGIDPDEPFDELRRRLHA